jgi:long-subunit acyl-CoA synthetase (AMP-forming)
MEKSLPLMPGSRARETPDTVAQYVKDKEGGFRPGTYRQLYDEVRRVAAGLLEPGCRRDIAAMCLSGANR